MRLAPAGQLSVSSNSTCLSTAAALRHQRRVQQYRRGQHYNISDVLRTASVQHRPAETCVSTLASSVSVSHRSINAVA
jgi:hypothetical protein